MIKVHSEEIWRVDTNFLQSCFIHGQVLQKKDRQPMTGDVPIDEGREEFHPVILTVIQSTISNVRQESVNPTYTHYIYKNIQASQVTT